MGCWLFIHLPSTTIKMGHMISIRIWYLYVPWQFLALSFLYFFRYFCLQWTVFSFYNAKEWKKEYMSTGISYTRVKPHNLSTSLFIIIIILIIIILIIIHIFVCSLFSHIQYSYITSYIHAYLFIYSWHTYTHTYKFKVPISCLGILRICNLWILLRKIVIYLVGRKFYLRGFLTSTQESVS